MITYIPLAFLHDGYTDTCGGDVFCVGITTICFEDRTKTEKKLVEAAMKFQQGYVDDLTEEFMWWIQPAVVIPYDKLALKIELHPEQFNSSGPIPY